jgi:hypothetical protein
VGRILFAVLLVAIIFLPILLIGWAGLRAFRSRNVWIENSVEHRWPAQDSARQVLAEMTPQMQKLNYRLSSEGQGTLVFTKTFRPFWLFIPCIVLFPIGLLSLLYTRTVDISFSLHSRPNGESLVAFSGKGPPYLGRQIDASLSNLDH